MKLSQLLRAMDEIAPLRLAEPWDNVGLLAGDPDQDVTKVLLAIDYTPDVAHEARIERCDCVVAYHPPIFDAVKRITAPSPIFEAIKAGIALYSPHTALDVAEGGTNDLLADALGLKERHPLRITPNKAVSCKLIVFSPLEAVEKISKAMFDAGAGRIGNYSCCSFRSPGHGTFFGDESTHPAAGQRGKLEQVEELRIETILPMSKVEGAIRALRQAHPYEEPAFDLVQLAAPPEGSGQGRIGDLPQAIGREELIARVKKALELEHVLVAGPTTGLVTRAACLAGVGREHLADALAQKAGVYLTGEIPHHDALRAASAGCTVIATLHSNSERGVLKRLASLLWQKLPDLPTVVSREDRDPFSIQ
jgi:dinuclear metal center YbgI/SA1388 family protein